MTGTVSPIIAGMRCKCPKCGMGDVFEGYLTFRKSCDHCAASFEIEDAGDGPAFFVIMLVGFLVVPLALGTQIALSPPIWVQLILWMPISIGLCVWLLRPFRALMLALQLRNKAEEAVFETAPSDKDT